MGKLTLLAFGTVMLALVPNAYAVNITSGIDINSIVQQIVPGNDAAPIALKGIDGQWEKPILIHSNKARSYYITDGSIVNNVVYNKDYYKTGSFSVILYTSYKSKSARDEVITFIKANGSVQYPETFRYMAEWVSFDVINKTAKITKQFIIDDYGKTMTFGTDDGREQNVKLDNKHLLFKELAHKISDIYKKSEKDPRIKDAQKYQQEGTIEDTVR